MHVSGKHGTIGMAARDLYTSTGLDIEGWVLAC